MWNLLARQFSSTLHILILSNEWSGVPSCLDIHDDYGVFPVHIFSARRHGSALKHEAGRRAPTAYTHGAYFPSRSALNRSGVSDC